MTKKYDVILADPPWKYNKQIGDLATDDFYSTMDLEEICSLPIGELAKDNSTLFLWTTPPTILDYAKPVIESWGFEYKTKAFCWVKANPSGFGFRMGTGYYTGSNTEDCLIAIKGSMPRVGHTTQIIFYPVQEHSRKPDDQYHKIETLYPNMEYLELFARRKRKGWDVWGNEVESDIELPISRDTNDIG